MAEKKMTRKEALEFAIDNIIANCGDDLEKCGGDIAIEVLEKMLTSINKQAARPRSKSSARLQNEPMAKEFIAKLREHGQPVNTKWMCENIRYCIHSQKAVAIAKIAIEWGEVEKVTIKGRTYYVPAGWIE